MSKYADASQAINEVIGEWLNRKVSVASAEQRKSVEAMHLEDFFYELTPKIIAAAESSMFFELRQQRDEARAAADPSAVLDSPWLAEREAAAFTAGQASVNVAAAEARSYRKGREEAVEAIAAHRDKFWPADDSYDSARARIRRHLNIAIQVASPAITMAEVADALAEHLKPTLTKEQARVLPSTAQLNDAFAAARRPGHLEATEGDDRG